MTFEKILAISIILALLFMIFYLCLAGCSETPVKDMALNELGLAIIERVGKCGDSDLYLVVDPQTGVEYFMVRGYSSFALSPRYDENGQVIVRKLEEGSEK